MANVLISGGTGLIGRALTKELLSRGHQVTVLTRSPEKYPNTTRVNYAAWDVERQIADKAAIVSADYIVHLAGAGVADKRWTQKRKKEIVESRTRSSELLVKALRESSNQVRAVISASAIGWYGENQGDSSFVETDPASNDFLGDTCKEWEQSIGEVSSLNKRLVKLRTGIVLSSEGGALEEFRTPLRFGLGTILGNGKQVISWIHIEDLVRLYIFAIENETMQGVYNAVAPYPVTNRNLILVLARQMRGRFFIPVYIPSFVLKLVLGEMSIEVLKSATVSAQKIKNLGFDFFFPSIKSAMHDLIL